MFATLLASFNLMAQPIEQLVRLAIIEVDSTQLDSYNAFLKEEVEASVEKEPGVITLYAIAEKENPERITLFETYADLDKYKAHLATPHFLKYKGGTAQMVNHLQLVEAQPMFYVRKAEISKADSSEILIRLIKLEIARDELSNFNQLAQTVMFPALKAEPGVLVFYAVAEKKDPTRISILEVYANSEAYKAHLNTSHFIKYKEESKNMIKSLKVIDVTPISLGSKPQG